jgi:pentatricopeptide repeat protein
MEVYQEMLRTGCERSVITYSALISACEKARQWQLALNLFSEMLKERCVPNVITYNSLITACAQVRTRAAALFVLEGLLDFLQGLVWYSQQYQVTRVSVGPYWCAAAGAEPVQHNVRRALRAKRDHLQLPHHSVRTGEAASCCLRTEVLFPRRYPP